ncbi:MAG: SHOCT domain-containing protein [Atopobiaceae bacterium]|nr:SHOCT domain-containing protein [Atopobiaceae bacterium]
MNSNDDPTIVQPEEPSAQTNTEDVTDEFETADKTEKTQASGPEEAAEEDVTYEDVLIDDVAVPADIPLGDDEALAYRLLKRTASLKGVAINREAFLRSELSATQMPQKVESAISSSPHEAGISSEVCDKLADAAIVLESSKVAGLSALAGIPGGLAVLGTIPADIMQYCAHSLRMAQKLAYLYGWESMALDEGDVDESTLYQLILLIGVMMNVEGTSVALARMSPDIASLGFAETLRQLKAQDEMWYVPIKKTLSAMGSKVTKGTFVEAIMHGVPMLSGLVSGSVTFVTFRFGAVALKKLLRELPQATGVVREAGEMQELAEQLEAQAKTAYDDALQETIEAAGEKVGIFAAQASDVAGDYTDRAGEMAAVFAEQAGAVASSLADKAAEYASDARDKAGEAAKAAAIGFIRGLGTRKKEKRRQKKQEAKGTEAQASAQAGSASDIAFELRTLKGLMDDGIITQEEFDAKKKQLLGL